MHLCDLQAANTLRFELAYTLSDLSARSHTRNVRVHVCVALLLAF
jgi:hypothetical protein